MRWALFWYCLYTNPVEAYPNSHWAPVPAKILSHLGYFTERSCFVTQGETDGEEANTEMCIVRAFYCTFPLFSLAWLVRSTQSEYTSSVFPPVNVGGCGSTSHFPSLPPSAIPPPWSHLLLKPVNHPSSLCSPNSAPSPAHAPGPPAPSPRELNYIWWLRRRNRLSRDLHNPCSPEHPMWLPCMWADVPTCTLIAK